MRSWSELSRDTRFWLSRRLGRSLAPPDWLTINLTLRCNLKCSMCTTCYEAPELSREQILDLVDQAAAWGVRVFNPLGGEPFVRSDLEEILAHAAHRNLHTTLTTNGTLIHRGRAERIAAVPPEKLHINVSIDGLEMAHDQIRGPGMFRRTLEGYRRLREADRLAKNPRRKICANSILHRGNIDTFEELIDFLEVEEFSGVQVLNLFRNGTEKTANDLWFTMEDLPKLEALTERLAARKSPFILNHPENLRMIPAYYREGLKPLEAPCWAGWKELYINADGTAIMCDGKLDFLKGHFGSVHRSTLRELWETEALQERRAVVKNCTQPCIQNCYLRRESDSLADLGKDAVKLATTPLRKRLIRPLSRQERPEVLVLEASDIPLDPEHPHFRRLLRHVEGEPLLRDPADYPRWRDQGRLDSSRGFLGLEVVERLLDQLDEEHLCFPTLSLRWRGEPLLHPALGDLWALLQEGRRRGSLKTLLLPGDPAFSAAWPGLPLSTIQAPTGPVIVVSWDATLTRKWEDQRLTSASGPLLHRPLRELLGE